MARKPGKWVSVPEAHGIRIAKDTLRMPDAMVGVMGGMDKPTARAILKKHGIKYKENPCHLRQRRANPARSSMTLKDWIKKWEMSPKKHSSWALYIPGLNYLKGPAQRELYRLDDYAVSSVSGGSLWLVPRKKNPGTKWHRKQENIHLKKHKGAMSKLGGKYYEGKIHAHQDSIREGWKRKPRRKK